MDLQDGRVAEMVAESTAAESCIPCHETLEGDQAVCRGFFEKHATQPLQIAERLGFIVFLRLAGKFNWSGWICETARSGRHE